ncbi:peptidoglycan/LPS O-acetylase OafA/YrhL [Sphingomonas zeicaulis]|uniref:acyltransferase family protein n=1 Tax=Sphingomonas zeicaulis TaxID=1632740 RepID=UPI003D227A1E
MATRQHDNNFTFLRFAAASMVIVAHAYDLQGIESVQDPLRRLTGHSMGWAGVSVFFVMSGYLIMKSLARTPNLIQFTRARALRIFPGLAVCMVLTVLLAGLFLTTLSPAAFFGSGQTAKYLGGNISLLSLQHHLPGVFEANPRPRAVNGSIWTLPYEVSCYIMAAALSVFGMLKNERLRIITFVLAALLSVLFTALQPVTAEVGIFARLAIFHGLAFCFLLGMAYASFGDRFILRWWYAPIAGLIAWLLAPTPFYTMALSVTVGLFVIWLAFVPSPLLRKLSRAPDYSYGIYIYAFPIQQTLIQFAPGLSPAMHALVAFLLVLIPASLSWHLVEKPALRFKKGGRTARAAAPGITDAVPRS